MRSSGGQVRMWVSRAWTGLAARLAILAGSSWLPARIADMGVAARSRWEPLARDVHAAGDGVALPRAQE
jgi:hypothetical protein